MTRRQALPTRLPLALPDFQSTHIRVLFFEPGNTSGWLVAFITRSRFTHVGIQIGDYYYEEVDSGFRRTDPRTDFAECLEFDAVVPPDVIAFLSETVGQRYSWTTIVADLVASYTPWKWQIEARGEHVCSGAVAWIMCLLGKLAFEAVGFQPDSITPGQLAKILGVK